MQKTGYWLRVALVDGSWFEAKRTNKRKAQKEPAQIPWRSDVESVSVNAAT